MALASCQKLLDQRAANFGVYARRSVWHELIEDPGDDRGHALLGILLVFLGQRLHRLHVARLPDCLRRLHKRVQVLGAGKECRHKLFEHLGVFGLPSGAVHGADTIGASAGHVGLLYQVIQLPKRLLETKCCSHDRGRTVGAQQRREALSLVGAAT